jgi:hypothetical protein
MSGWSLWRDVSIVLSTAKVLVHPDATRRYGGQTEQGWVNLLPLEEQAQPRLGTGCSQVQRDTVSWPDGETHGSQHDRSCGLLISAAVFLPAGSMDTAQTGPARALLWCQPGFG